MGAINFKTGDYITIGFPYQDDYTDEDNNTYAYPYEDDYAEVQDILEGINGNYNVKVTLEYGYYESFSVAVDDNEYSYFDDYEEKLDCMRHIKDIETRLNKLIDTGMRVCSPSWGTTWYGYKDSKIYVKVACREMREVIRTTPIYKNYVKARKNNYVQEV